MNWILHPAALIVSTFLAGFLFSIFIFKFHSLKNFIPGIIGLFHGAWLYQIFHFFTL